MTYHSKQTTLNSKGEQAQAGSPAVPLTTEATADSPAIPTSVNLAFADDPVFAAEQQHLTTIYETLQQLKFNLIRKMEHTSAEAAADKKSMAEELSPDFATYSDAMETYADFASMNRIIDAYNISHDVNVEKLSNIQTLLNQPYFAKIVLQYKPDQPFKELYIGNAGMSDESYKRLVVDWRSPVAEVYYNQDEGPTSYVADGRVIHTDLKLRRQFDIEKNHLNAYFDTSVAIQDALLLSSLSKRRTDQMQAITATIQKEQNLVVRHEDVPVLLVSGIAGSGKTSVLLQRIAYLFYQQRSVLDPREVFLITPNPVFRHYIENVLPDLGEHNPELLTWDEFVQPLLPRKTGIGNTNISIDALERIDAVASEASFEFDQDDFKDINGAGKRLLSVDQIRKVAAKFDHIPAGPHRVTLMREELLNRLQSRLGQMAGSEEVQDEVAALSLDEQLRLFHTAIDPAIGLEDDHEMHAFALTYLNDRYSDAFAAVQRDEWLRIDRIGMRLLGVSGLSPIEWLFLKMTICGLSNTDAKYVMIDEVQDYSAAQLAVLARYFRRAHFLLLGDPNQAITEKSATFDEVRAVFGSQHGSVAECRLMTSYRSTPEITALFANLLPPEERSHIQSIQRTDTAPALVECPDAQTYEAELRRAIDQENQHEEGLTAVIVPWKHEAHRLQKLLGNSAPPLVTESGQLPTRGVMLIPLNLAKGLEFDKVIVPDASVRVFPDNPLSRRRLYTTLSRATHEITVLAQGKLTPLLG